MSPQHELVYSVGGKVLESYKHGSKIFLQRKKWELQRSGRYGMGTFRIKTLVAEAVK